MSEPLIWNLENKDEEHSKGGTASVKTCGNSGTCCVLGIASKHLVMQCYGAVARQALWPEWTRMALTGTENSVAEVRMTEGEEIISSALDILNLRCPQDVQLDKVTGNSGPYIKVVGDRDVNLRAFHA